MIGLHNRVFKVFFPLDELSSFIRLANNFLQGWVPTSLSETPAGALVSSKVSHCDLG